MKRLPKTLYIKTETPANGDPYFVADANFQALAEAHENIVVGIYKLQSVATIVCKPELVGGDEAGK